jgi:hypothetical protein
MTNASALERVNTYLETRLDPQTSWYDKRAFQNKFTFLSFSIIAIGASAAIPVSVATGGSEWIGAALGGLVSVVSALLSVLKSQENWLHYRSTAELLRKERAFFSMSAGPYARDELDGRDAAQTLVERVEDLISSEHTAWHQRRSGRTSSSEDSQSVGG